MAVKVDTQKEIIFGSSDPNISRVLSKKEKEGELRKVAAHGKKPVFSQCLDITSYICKKRVRWRRILT